MNPKCRAALNVARQAAGGKPLTDAQAANIETRIKGAGKVLREQDPSAWRAMPEDQRTLMAAQKAAEEIAFEAVRKVQNAQRQVIKRAEFLTRVQQHADSMKLSKAQAVAADYQVADDRITGMVGEYGAHLMNAIDAAKSTQGVGAVRWVLMKAFDAQNPQMSLDIAKEIHAKGKAGTKNDLAIKAAKAWDEMVAEPMRVRFNEAGGNVGRLDYGYMPTMWEPELVGKAGHAAFADAVLPHLDRKRYTRDDGSLMDDAEVLTFLQKAGETIATDGANKMEPGTIRGTGARANSGSEHRQIHFKDGESYVKVMAQFGSGSMYDAMMGHLNMMSRDIVLVERYGPNPDAQHKLMRDDLIKADKGGLPASVTMADLNHHWRVIAGSQVARWRWTPPAAGVVGDFTGAGMSRFFGHARNVETFSKLQGAVISSITDVPMYFAALHMNKLPILDGLANIPKAMAGMTPGVRRIYGRNLVETMNGMGMAADTVLGSFNRFTGENASTAWSGHLSSATMRLGLLNWWTDSLRLAYSNTMQNATARNVKTPWGELDEYLRVNILGRNGITEAHWSVLGKAQTVETQWGPLLTPESIYATGDPMAADTVNAYLGFLRNRQESAILNPDVAARAFWRRSTESGSAGGEISRAISQFQMFPTSMFTRFYREVLQARGGLEGAPAGFGDMPFNRLAFIGSSVAMMTFFGAIAFQAKQMKDGKDPVDMTTLKFGVRALAQGGGFGYLSGLILEDSSDSRSIADPLYRMQGPIMGSVAESFELTVGNLHEAAAGKDTHAGAEAIRFVRGHAPLVNLWYIKSAIDHAALHSMQEAVSPGYLSRIRSKQKKDWGGGYWWQPGERMPDRAPSFEQLSGAN